MIPMKKFITDLDHQNIVELFDSLFSNSREGIIITNDQREIIAINPAFSNITQYTAEEIIGQKPSFLSSDRHEKDFYEDMQSDIKKKGRWSGNIWDRRKNGEVFLTELTIVAVQHGPDQKVNYVGILNDTPNIENNITQKQNHDPLTNLPNRILFQEHFQFLLAHARRNDQILALLLLDIDRFKVLNDTLGYNAGDMILTYTAERLKETLREVDVVFRLGNDEFAIILEEVAKVEDTAIVAKRIFEAFSKPFNLACYEKDLYLSTSIGISIFPQDGSHFEDLIKNAEVAMYQAKKEEQNNFCHYSPSMNEATLELLTMEHQLHKALEQKEFIVYYQPIIDIRENTIVGAEALARWQHPELGLVPPFKFIPIAEETGLIIPIGEYIMVSACKMARHWHSLGFDNFHISVNLSARQFQQHDLVEKMEIILMESKLPPKFLELEITESIGMQDAENTIKILEDIKKKGIYISIDDFGTGYSSLSYLKRFPINTLKVDRSFVKDIGISLDSETIVSVIITMAHTLNLKVIAEGVETVDQLAFLKAHKCDMLQGYLFSKPVPAEEFEALLKKTQKSSK